MEDDGDNVGVDFAEKYRSYNILYNKPKKEEKDGSNDASSEEFAWDAERDGLKDKSDENIYHAKSVQIENKEDLLAQRDKDIRFDK